MISVLDRLPRFIVALALVDNILHLRSSIEWNPRPSEQMQMNDTQASADVRNWTITVTRHTVSNSKRLAIIGLSTKSV